MVGYDSFVTGRDIHMSMYFLAQTKSKTIALQLPAVESESAQQSRCLQHDELQKKMQSKSEND